MVYVKLDLCVLSAQGVLYASRTIIPSHLGPRYIIKIKSAYSAKYLEKGPPTTAVGLTYLINVAAVRTFGSGFSTRRQP